MELSLAPRVRPRLRLSIAPGHCRTTISPQDSLSSPRSKRRHYRTTSYIWSDLYSNAKIEQQEAEPKTPNNMSINPAETHPLGQGQDTTPSPHCNGPSNRLPVEIHGRTPQSDGTQLHTMEGRTRRHTHRTRNEPHNYARIYHAA